MECTQVSECHLPIQFFSQQAIVNLVFFRCGDIQEEVIALIHKGKNFHDQSVPLVRIHSACLTGEVFGSQKCDCGYQFEKAMEEICKSDYGIMLYMASQEGRGIGLANKILAYQIQEKGIDTIEANTMLGFPVDARNFTPAINVLKHYNIQKIKLLTNNPEKVKAVRESGIQVLKQITLSAYVNCFNENYLHVKQQKLKHKFKSFLPVPYVNDERSKRVANG